jgi:CubicO group peptidase (beta-lactamase class C family)
MDGYVHPDFGSVSERVRTMLGKKSTTGGIAVVVYHHGEKVVDVWGGTRDQAGRPWERDTMSMSFSTTKGVVATTLHRLADRGEVEYNEPVATYWPEFAQAGKENITVRHLLTHRAGLHPIKPLVDDASEILDWDHMAAKLAAAAPVWEPGTRPGYHALTFGWLVGEVIRRVTGLSVRDAVRREVAEPLGLDGLHIGAPPEVRDDVADLIFDPSSQERLDKMTTWMEKRDRFRPFVDALVVDGFNDYVNTDEIYEAQIPAANGVFTARSLARMYAALATPGDFDGEPLISADTMERATVVQSTQRDAVVMFPMRWRLGYHLAATTAGAPPEGFGHFGFGGSGAWGDPETGLAVAMVLNQIGGTPFGDTRFARVGAVALKSARQRDGIPRRRKR